MAILNLTPDSFYDGGSYKNMNQVLKKVEQFLVEGADILDIGAYSSRPGAVHISEFEESNRLIPVLKEVKKEFPEISISIDTFRSTIAKACIEEGAHIINDISGGTMDENIYQVVAKYQVPYVLTHMQGTPQNMQSQLIEGDIVAHIHQFFKNKIDFLAKISVNNVILDVGFGFGKSIEQNFELLRHLETFNIYKKPILVGLSRKSMLYKPLKTTPDQSLNATSIAHTLAILNGANILRVHDVREANEVIEILKKYRQMN